MVYKLYSVRDKLVGFGAPMCDSSDASATRAFGVGLVNNAQNKLIASDLDLYRIGVFDSDTGMVTADTVPVLVTSGIDAVGMIGGDA